MKYLLSISYDGSNYFGWAKQKNHPTIQQQLEISLKNLFKKNILTVGASRTDAKVHALDQKVLINFDWEIECQLLKTILNRSLPNDIYINNCEIITNDSFNVRYSVREKEYHYLISFKKNNPFQSKYYLQIDEQLDINKLQKIFNIFIGKHNFSNFSSIKRGENINSERTVEMISVLLEKDIIKIIFKAKSFIRYQIRMIIGSALACYNGLITEQYLMDQLSLKIKTKTKFKIIGNGLYLAKITY